MIPPLWATLTVTLVLFLCAPRRWTQRPRSAVVVLVLALGAACVPLNGLPVAAWIRGAIDDLSMVSMMLLALACFCRVSGRTFMSMTEKRALRVMVLTAGVVLYPASLGMAMADPWQWGFEPRWMITLTGLMAVLMGLAGGWTLAMLLGMATMAFVLGLKESPNYWDYLLDPLLVITMAVECLSAAIARGRNRPANA
jgi:hypothetical protein